MLRKSEKVCCKLGKKCALLPKNIFYIFGQFFGVVVVVVGVCVCKSLSYYRGAPVKNIGETEWQIFRQRHLLGAQSLVKLSHGLNFINVLSTAFCTHRSQKCKKLLMT